VNLNNPAPAPPYTTWATAATNIQDAIDAADDGDEVVVTNGVYKTGGRAVSGTMTNRVTVDKPLTVCSVNGPEATMICGYQVPGTTIGDGAVRCVYLANGAVLKGFTLTNGATRASGDDFLEQSGGGLRCDSTNAVVTDCVLSGNSAGYGGGGAYGGTLSNCTLVGNRAGSGGGAYASALSHCTLTGNSAGYRGGGAFSAILNNCTLNTNSAAEYGGATSEGTLNNCTIYGNSAEYGGGAFFASLNRCTLTGNSAESGGGTYGGTLDNCTLTGNSGEHGGGGAYDGTLNNCTLTGNSAEYGGGVAYGGVKFRSITLNNCIVYFNTARLEGANYQVRTDHGRAFLTRCCTVPVASDDVGSFTNAPLFWDQAGGNFRLQANSPCINAGRNANAPTGLDLDGNPRIVGGTVDVGAYEFQSPLSLISYVWLDQYGLPTDGSADSTDADGDGMTNWQEWRAGTNPNDPFSLLRLLPPVPLGPDLFVSWQSAVGVSYFLERSMNLTSPLLFTPLATNLSGQTGVTTYTDTNTVVAPRLFYRVGVE
jgi:hypothetical protein